VLVTKFTITEIWWSCSPKNIHIHGLPVEILCQITDNPIRQFPQCFSDKSAQIEGISFKYTNPLGIPLLYCQISGMGILLHIRSGHVGLKGCIRPVDTQFLTWWIGRSQATPLVFLFDFLFQQSNGLMEIQMRMQREIWERMKVDPAVLLFRIISNARGLYLNDFTSVVLQKDLSHRNLQFPNLRSLANLANILSSRSGIGPILHLDTLRHLIYHKPQVLDSDILWENLTHISIKTLSISSKEWCNLIRCLEALQIGEFAATVDALATRTTMEYPSKKLSHLRELQLCLYLNSDIDFNPLPNLVFPSLTMLHYEGPNLTPNFLRKLFLASPHSLTLHLGRRHRPLYEADISPSYRTRFLFNIQLYPPPNLRRVHFTSRPLLFKRWRLKFMEWRLRCKPGINVVPREETNCYWGLSPSEHRAWMEMWYVMI